MSSLSSLTISQKLNQQNIPLLDTTSFQRLFNISSRNTVYKTLQRLTKQNILQRLNPGKYLVTNLKPSKFAIANFLYSPSYVSLESALNHYGILPQFPFTITSITTKRTKAIENHSTYDYSHLSPQFYWGFEQQQDFIIATPEKALLDLMYFASKGLRQLPVDELDLSVVNKKKLKNNAKNITTPQFTNYFKEINLC